MRQNSWLADLFEIQYGLGLRVGEALALTAHDIHVSGDGQITVLIAATIITPKGKRPFRQEHTKDGPNGRRRLTPPLGWQQYCLSEHAE